MSTSLFVIVAVWITTLPLTQCRLRGDSRQKDGYRWRGHVSLIPGQGEGLLRRETRAWQDKKAPKWQISHQRCHHEFTSISGPNLRSLSISLLNFIPRNSAMSGQPELKVLVVCLGNSHYFWDPWRILIGTSYSLFSILTRVFASTMVFI